MLDPSIIVDTNQVPAAGGPALVSLEAFEKARRQADLGETRGKLLSAALELQTELDGCRDFDAVAVQAARLIAGLTVARRVQIAWRDQATADVRIVADSDSTSTADVVLATAAGEEIAARGSIAELPCTDHANRHALLATRQYCEAAAASSFIGVPLGDRNGNPRGAVMAIDPDPASLDHTRNLLAVMGPALSQKLAHFQSMQPRHWERILRSVIEPVAGRHRHAAALIAAFLSVLMLIPVGYNVPANCELQPVHRRFVAAPFDGPLEKVLVRPGDVVEKEDTLARINSREIEYQLAGLRADLKRAEQETKGLVVEHDFAGSNIARLEARRIQLETELLQYQRDHLEIRSPLSGVVVDGDLETAEGTPLTKGETLFEIAPLGEMIVEIAIAEEDLAYVRKGMEVEFYLHALPDRNLHGVLKHIHPKAELRDHDNVFIGEVYIEDEENVLRPGMRGRSWVQSDRHPLGWNLFHKAYFALRHTLGW